MRLLPVSRILPVVLSLAVLSAARGQAPVITSPDTVEWYLPDHRIDITDEDYYTITATGNPTIWDAYPMSEYYSLYRNTFSYGSMPPGTYHVTLSATNAYGTGTKVLTITVPVQENNFSASSGTYAPGDTLRIMMQYNGIVNVGGTPYVPLTVGGAPRQATYVRGSGTNALVYTYTFQASDPAGQVYVSTSPAGGTFTDPNGYTVVHELWYRFPPTIYFDPTRAPQPPVTSAPVIESPTTATGTVGSSFTYGIYGSYQPTTFSASPVPPGLTFNPVSGALYGKPTVAGTYPVTIQATNAVGTATAQVTITIAAGPPPAVLPVITSPTTATATVGTPFSYTAEASNSPTWYRIGGLPDGITYNAMTHVASGTPTTAGSYTISVQAGNAAGTAYILVPLTVSTSAPPPPPSPSAAPVITSGTALTVAAGAPIAYTVQATNSPASFAASPLPAGLSFDTTTGVLSGTISAAGTYTITLQATNAAGTGTAQFVLTVASPSAPPPPPPPPPPPGPALTAQTITFTALEPMTVGQSTSLNASATSGLPVTFAVVSGNASVSGNTLTVNGAGTVVVRATQEGNSTYAPATAEREVAVSRATQQVAFSSPVSAIYIGQPIRLGAIASSGLPVTYTVVRGPATVSGDTLLISGTDPVVVRATQAGNATFTAAETEFTFNAQEIPQARLANLSGRAQVTDADAAHALIAGFVVSGSAPKRLLLRAVGPALAAYGVTNALPNPRIEVYDSASTLIAQNEDWSGTDVSTASTAMGAFALPAGSRDAALVVTLPPGNYSMRAAANGGSGVALVEIYDLEGSATTTRLMNISTRGNVGTGENALVAGFFVSGNTPKRVLVRAVGPGLTAYGVGGALTDPAVTVYQGSTVVAQNDDWQVPQAVGTQAAATAAELAAASASVGAFALGTGSRDAAVVVTLAPGTYTAVMTGQNGTTGAGLIEVYELP